LQRNAELRARMGRYQLIGDVMRGGVTQATGLGIAGRVQDALTDDPVIEATTESTDPADRQVTARLFWKPAVGIAIAASVALVAVLSMQNLQQSQPETTQLAVTRTAPPVVQVSTNDAQWDRIEPRVEKRLSGYLVNHSEFAASRGLQGLNPYVRIVGFEDAQ
jgi:sigma-E factor negative regulatory protein RseA